MPMDKFEQKMYDCCRQSKVRAGKHAACISRKGMITHICCNEQSGCAELQLLLQLTNSYSSTRCIKRQQRVLPTKMVG